MSDDEKNEAAPPVEPGAGEPAENTVHAHGVDAVQNAVPGDDTARAGTAVRGDDAVGADDAARAGTAVGGDAAVGADDAARAGTAIRADDAARAGNAVRADDAARAGNAVRADDTARAGNAVRADGVARAGNARADGVARAGNARVDGEARAGKAVPTDGVARDDDAAPDENAVHDGPTAAAGNAAPDEGSAPTGERVADRAAEAERAAEADRAAEAERAAERAAEDEKTVVLDDTTVVLTNPKPERFAGLLPAPGPAGRRRYEPSSPAPEVEPEERESVQPEADIPVGRSFFGRRWAGGNRAAALIGVLLGLLGFALAVQVRSNTATNGLSGARQEDLVRILDDLSSREERLRTQISSLEAARARLTTTGDKNTAALNEAKTRSQALGVLAGTLPAQGPGIVLNMSDPHAKLKAEDILDAVEELRAAGAEAIQVGQVRIGLNSSFIDDGSTIRADGQPLATPYQILAIGDAATLATALNIPGGVVDTVRQAGGQATITQQDKVVIRVLRSLSTPHYAQPAE
jgi:uncharacterized protein YlxW (UPF0749 family)